MKFFFHLLFLFLLCFCLSTVIENEKYSQEDISLIKQNSSGNLDLVFLVDNTGSMLSQVELVKSKLLYMIDEISKLPLLTGKLRLGLVAYRDFEDSWVTKKQILTTDITLLKSVVNQMIAEGGGDLPEAAAEGFYETVRMDWSEDAAKLLVWVADAPPHDRNAIRQKQKGLYWENQIENLKEMGVVVHSVNVARLDSTLQVMEKVGMQTSGIIIQLEQSELLIDIIVGLCIEGLDRLYIKAHVDHILEQYHSQFRNQNDEEIVKKVTNLINNKNVLKKSFRLRNNTVVLDSSRLEVIDIKNVLKYNKLSNTPCDKWGILCKYKTSNSPQFGLINNKTQSSLPLLETNIYSEVFDNMGIIYYNQTFENHFNETITGSFIFPLPAGASVIEFEAIINGNLIQGRLLEKSLAKRVYEKAIKMGSDAYLLAEEDNNVFKMEIGNFPPQSRGVISLKILNKLISQDNSVRLVIPTDVIPNYNLNPNYDNNNENKVAKSKIHFHMKSIMTSDITQCEIKSRNDYNITRIVTGKKCEISIDNIDLTKDFVVDIIYNPKKENQLWLSLNNVSDYYSGHLTVYPKLSFHEPLKIDQVTLVIDCSYSLSSVDIQKTVKEISNELMKMIKESYGDERLKFNLVLFNNDVEIPVLNEILDDDVLQRSTSIINSMRFVGGTNIIEAFYKIESNIQDKVSRIFLITDGQVAGGKDFLSYVYSLFSTNEVALQIIGVGHSPNYEMINSLAYYTRSIPEFILPGERFEDKLHSQVNRSKLPKLNVDVFLKANEISKISLNNMTRYTVIDGSKLEINYLYKINSSEKHNFTDLEIQIKNPKTNFYESLIYSFSETGENKLIIVNDTNLIHLMSASDIVNLMELNEEFMGNEKIKQEIIDLCLNFNITSKYTSFIAVEETILSEILSQATTFSAAAPKREKKHKHSESHKEGDFIYSDEPPLLASSFVIEAEDLPRKDMKYSVKYDLSGGAESYSSKEYADSVVLIDVTPLTLGIENSINGEFIKIVPKGTVIPTKKTKIFSFIKDEDQTTLRIKIFEGERLIAIKNNMRDEIEIIDLPLGRNIEMEITLEVDENGIVTIRILEKSSSKKYVFKLKETMLDRAAVENLLSESEKFIEQDELYIKTVNLKISIKNVLNSFYDDYNKISKEEKDHLKNILKEFQIEEKWIKENINAEYSLLNDKYQIINALYEKLQNSDIKRDEF